MFGHMQNRDRPVLPDILPVVVIVGVTLALNAIVIWKPGTAPFFASLAFMPVVYTLLHGNFRTTVTVGLLVAGAQLVYAALPALFSKPLTGPPDWAAVLFRAFTLSAIGVAGGICQNRFRHLQELLAAEAASHVEIENAIHWIDSSTTLEDAIEIVMHSIMEYHPNAGTVIYLLDESRSKLIARGIEGEFAGRNPESMTIELGSALTESTLSTPIYRDTRTAKQDSSADPFLAFVPQQGSYAMIPFLRPDTRLSGIVFLCFDSSQSLSADTFRRIQTFVKGVSSSLERIRIQNILHGMAYTDAMTGLKNYRAFLRDLSEEVRRSARYERSLALMIVDLDRFKTVNDTYGHPTGNRALCYIAMLLQETLRESDLPARFGGEEFVVLCPETGLDAALAVAERIRRTVEAHPLPITDTQRIHLTLSIGVAVYPTDAESESELIQRADAALLLAKRAGRNQVCAAPPRQRY